MKWAAVAAGMNARRALSQSLAREFGPQGVHVAHAIIDGVIDIPRAKSYTNINGGVEDGKISPDAVSWVEAFYVYFDADTLVDCRELLASSHPAPVCVYA